MALNVNNDQVKAGGKEDCPFAVKGTKTWLALKLVDEDGSPVSGKSCRIKYPDGTELIYVTGDDGEITLTNIEPGSYSAEFKWIDKGDFL